MCENSLPLHGTLYISVQRSILSLAAATWDCTVVEVTVSASKCHSCNILSVTRGRVASIGTCTSLSVDAFENIKAADGVQTTDIDITAYVSMVLTCVRHQSIAAHCLRIIRQDDSDICNTRHRVRDIYAKRLQTSNWITQLVANFECIWSGRPKFTFGECVTQYMMRVAVNTNEV